MIKKLLFSLLLFVSVAEAAPNIALWQQNMTTFGACHCATIKDTGQPFDTRQLATYYDGELVYGNIMSYTGDVTTWQSCYQGARDVYGTQYAVANGGNVPGYWNFTRGLRTFSALDGIGPNAVHLLATNAAFARDSTPEDVTDFHYSREVAYAIGSYLDDEALGQPPRARLATLVSAAKGHLDAYNNPANFVKPFFIALTVRALAQYDEAYPGDGAILAKVQTIANTMWTKNWDAPTQSMLYIDKVVVGEDPPNPAPDLNNLIAPVYGWLYAKTGVTDWKDKGDLLFNGGLTVTTGGCPGSPCAGLCFVSGSYMFDAKQFNQNFVSSFDYLNYTTGTTPTPTPGPSTPTPTSVPTSTPTLTPTATNTPLVTNTPTPAPTSSGPGGCCGGNTNTNTDSNN